MREDRRVYQKEIATSSKIASLVYYGDNEEDDDENDEEEEEKHGDEEEEEPVWTAGLTGISDAICVE